MNCPRCGYEVADGQKFCNECGASLPENAPEQVFDYGYAESSEPYDSEEPVRPNSRKWLIPLIIGISLFVTIIIVVVAFVAFKRVAKNIQQSTQEHLKDMDLHIDVPQDVDLDELNKAVDEMKNLDLTPPDMDINIGDIEVPEVPDITADETKSEPQGDKTEYSYVDVYRNGNEVKVIPNGKLNGSTVLANGKDLDGFLDYVDNTVLEKGRNINRSFFYEILATMLVDKDMNPGFEDIEKNMIMALAMGNNFYNTDVTVIDCDLDANNAAEYRYNVKAYGKDDTWLVNYQNRTIYFNNGKTEYSSDMFKTDYLSMWMIAIEEYYNK